MGGDLRLGTGAFTRAEASTSGCNDTTMEEYQDLRGNAWGRACVGGCALAVGGDIVLT